MTHAKLNFNQLMLTLIFGIRASEAPPRAWRTTEKAGPDRVNTQTEIIKSFAGQRLRKLEEQCVHHFNLINLTMSILWITSSESRKL